HRVFQHYCGCKQFGEMYSIVSPGTSTIPYIRAIGDSEIIVVNVQSQASWTDEGMCSSPAIK
ncbi:MAG: hypothetical protein LUG17_00345, partial [Clostridiales bacterium]|nr:hypothetical protein [Clostridiales bacterium]